MKAEHVEQHTQLHPVYLDKNSGLTQQQIDTINTILFGQYRRFRRSVAVVEEDEPTLVRNFVSTTAAVQDIFDRSYGIAHTFSAIMSVANKGAGSKVTIGHLKNQPSALYQSGGTGYNNSESLPGYFSIEGDEMIFNVTDDHENNYFRIYLFWMD